MDSSMVRQLFWLQLLVLVIVLQTGANKTMTDSRKKKALSVFTVVKFPNTACTSNTAGRNGTCYTSSECSAKGGSSSGTCASSFGVCCVFEKSCGAGTYSENSTYFTSTAITLGGSCSLTICKSDNDVCQLRLDFETFGLSNPVTVTTVTSGTVAVGAGSSNGLGQCQTDTFSVTVPGGKAPPMICGTNTGEHMYVPASSACNILTANIGTSSTASTSAFAIKVTQIECSSKTKAPNGCLQYFTGTTGTITTYNYNSGTGVLLANQDYSTCQRAERTMCTICYYAATTAFKMSVYNGIEANGAKGFDTLCGYPGVDGTATSGGGYDYIEIPNGQCDSPVAGVLNTANIETVDRYCGTQLDCANTFAIAGTPANTVCSSTRPFKVSVHSDSLEYGNPAADAEGSLANNRGFSISYFQKTTCLTKPNA